MRIESMIQLDQVPGIYPRCPVGWYLFYAIFSTHQTFATIGLTDALFTSASAFVGCLSSME